MPFGLGRYKFHIIIEHRITEKGEVENINAYELTHKFKKSDHPDVYKWCLQTLSATLAEHMESVKLQNPDSNIIAPAPITEIETTKDTD